MLFRSNGGKTVHTLFSGPAAGAQASAFLAESDAERGLVTLDMGGTSADIAFIEGGAPLETTEGIIARRQVDVPALDMTTISAGGGSIAAIDNGGFLTVVRASESVFRILPDDVFLSFLPLSHLYERVAGHWCAFWRGATVAYARTLHSAGPNTTGEPRRASDPVDAVLLEQAGDALRERVGASETPELSNLAAQRPSPAHRSVSHGVRLAAGAAVVLARVVDVGVGSRAVGCLAPAA